MYRKQENNKAGGAGQQALKREDVGELRAMFDALWEEKGGGET